MEAYASILLFMFGIITWIPFLNNVYGHDVASNLYLVNQARKGNIVINKDSMNCAVGHYFHTMFMQSIWDKYNTKAFYWIMCLYTSISSVTLFWVLNHLAGFMPAVLGSMLFSLYIVSPRLDGNWGPFEQLIPLPLFGSILCLLISPATNTYALIFLGGMLLGYATLIKQTAYIYLPGFFLMVAGTGQSLYHHLIFLCGIILINLIPVLYYWLRHNAFWEYLTSICLYQLPFAVNPSKYNKFYPQLGQRGVLNNKKEIKQVIINNSRSLIPMFFLSIIGIFVLFSYNFSLLYLGLLMCLIVSVLMVFMRKTFFPHYWLNLIPWFAIFSGLGLSEVIQCSFRLWPPDAVTIAGMLAVILLFIDAVFVDRKYYVFSRDPYQFLRKIYGEALVNQYKKWSQIGKYIRDTTKSDDKILICGYAPHILLYSDRAHFTAEPCLYTDDYIEIFNRDNPTHLNFLNSIYKFKNFKLVKQKENIFHKGYPKVVVFVEGKVDIKSFEKLTGIKYSIDENMNICPLYRADLELTELMSMYEKTNTDRLPSEESINLKKNDLIGSVNQQDWNTALETTKHLLAKAPQNRELLSILGDCLIKLGNFKLLFGFYNRLIGEKSVSVRMKLELLNKLGVAYCCLNKLNEAETLFKKILGAKPDNPVVLNNLGYVYNKQNKVGEAVECFQKSLKIDPNNEDAINNLGQIKAQCA